VWSTPLPSPCPQCARLLLPAESGGPAKGELAAGVLTHDALAEVAAAGHIEWGIWLYRCRMCDTWWEYDVATYFPESSRLRRVRPVLSVDRWRAKQRRAMRPPSALIGGVLLFLAGLLLIGIFAAVIVATEALFCLAGL
jgi:hypothetical protein